MFTGLIEETGVIRGINRSAEGANLVIAAQTVLSDLKIGDSVAVSGPCLTVTAKAGGSFTAWVMPETLNKTNLKDLVVGSAVNLERALVLGSRLGGHMVSGHIDAAVKLTGRQREGGAILLHFKAPVSLLRYIVAKGSVALEGVSLTVAAVNEGGFSVGVIPHTAEQTTIGAKNIGDSFNLEVDIIGKYVEKMLQPVVEAGEEKSSGITLSLLQEKGYL